MITWRVLYRSEHETVEVFAQGLTQGMAESLAAVLRAWMPRAVFAAWAEPEWASLPARPVSSLASGVMARMLQAA